MAWDYADKINNLALKDVAKVVRLESEGANSNPDAGLAVPGHAGVIVDPRAPFGPKVITLRTVLRWTNKDGLVNHTDGQAGHIFENKAKIDAELAGLATYERTYPHIGTVVAENVRLIADPTPGDVRNAYLWPLLIPSGTWKDKTESTATGTPPTVTTKGTRHIYDPVLIMSGAGEFEYTNGDGTVFTVTAAAGPTYPVTIDVGAGTVIDDDDQSARSAVTFSQTPWLVLDPASSLSLTADVECTLKWRNQWG